MKKGSPIHTQPKLAFIQPQMQKQKETKNPSTE
jgi:hypothetical protein